MALAPEGGYTHVGPVGAGHFVKMVHNGIEYGLMQAYAEGFEIMDRASEFDLDLHEIASIWRYGSVVRSWLLELAERALAPGSGFEKIEGYVVDSGEGKWTVQEALERSVPAPVISAALYRRFASREPDAFSNRLVAASEPIRRARRGDRTGRGQRARRRTRPGEDGAVRSPTTSGPRPEAEGPGSRPGDGDASVTGALATAESGGGLQWRSSRNLSC